MRTISQALLNFLINASWQLVLLAAVASCCAWLLRNAAARHRHLLWVATLALSAGLPWLAGSQLLPVPQPLRRAVLPAAAAESSGSEPPFQGFSNQRKNPALESPADSTPVTQTSSRLQVSERLALVLVLLYLLVLVHRGLKFVRAWRRTRTIKSSSHSPVISAELAAIVDRCETAIGITNYEIRSSAEVLVPLTLGIRRPLIILPDQLLREADGDVLSSAIGHELVHVLRRDYLRNLIYEVIYLALSFHPAAALVRRRINQTRELSCDELVTEKLLTAEVYARSLVRLAGSAVPFGRHATLTVGIADADILEVRIMSILSKSRLNRGRARLLLIAASILLATPCVAAAAFGLRVDIAPSEPLTIAAQQSAQSTERARLVYKTNPEYTEDARQNKIEGTVGLVATVGPNGLAQNIVVTRPLYPSLDGSAVGALKKWRWDPLIKDGQPVSAKVDVQMVFSLNEWAPEERKRAEEAELRGSALESQDPAKREEEKKLRRDLEEREQVERALKERAEFEGREYKLRAEMEDREMKLRQEMEERAMKLRAEHDPQFREELEARMRHQQEERKAMMVMHATLARTARISMEQAIQIANSLYPGKVMECSLVGEHWEELGKLAKDSHVLYRVVIISSDEPNPTVSHVLVNAIDGTIYKTGKEERDR